jgi:hypothetical protein
MRCLLAVSLVCVFAVFEAKPALAQEGTASYPAAYFAANQPSTAYEMVTLLPGFHIQLGDATVRGFSGTVGNVLIDGQLPTSKEDTVEVLLRRIPASSVDHIELIRGAADMHGYAVLANVVRSRGASLQGRTEVEGAITHTGITAPKLALHLVRQGESSTAELSASWVGYRLDEQQWIWRACAYPRRHPAAIVSLRFSQAPSFAELAPRIVNPWRMANFP